MPIGKSRHYRVFDPELYHEVTQRIGNGKFLLDPNSPALKAAIYGQLGQSLARYRIALLALHFMTDHFHAIYAITCPHLFAKFLAHFHAGLTRRYNRLRAAESPGQPFESASLWHEMKWLPVATDERTVRWRLGYVMGQAVAAGLVDHPVQFPGASTADAMVFGTPILGKSYDGPRRYRDSRRQSGALPDPAYEAEVTVTVTPPACWQHLPPEELRARYIEVADSVANIPLAELRDGQVGKQRVPLVATWRRPDDAAGAAGPEAESMASTEPSTTADPVPDTSSRPAEDSVSGDPGHRQDPVSTADFSLGQIDKRFIEPRFGDDGAPYEAGRAKAKPSYYTSDGKRKKRPLILSCSATVREAYAAAYGQWVADYLGAKERFREASESTSAGLCVPGLVLPRHMLLGSMPYPRS